MRLFLIILILLASWGAGLLAFANRVANSTPPPDPPQADAIVALTGASIIRLEAAEALLEEGLGQRLLISGVNRETTRKQVRATLIADNRAAADRAFDCCVDLGFEAENTLGNARETAPWVARHHYHTLIVVTADYHMPRAIFVIGQRLPGVALIGVPVRPPAMSHMLSLATWRVLAVEYTKYLITRAGLDDFAGADVDTTQ